MIENKKLKVAIVVYCYNRPNNLDALLSSLANANNFKDYHTYIFSDNSKSIDDGEKVKETRKVATKFAEKNGNCVVHFREKNYGLKKSVITGLNYVFEKKYDAAIVLEDDLELDKRVIDYFVRLFIILDENEYGSISAYTYPLFKSEDDMGLYWAYRNCSWGWGVSRKNWINFDRFLKNKKINISTYVKIIKCGIDSPIMLVKQMRQTKFDSWAILFQAYQVSNNLRTIYPAKSLIKNDGYFSGVHGSKNISNEYHPTLLLDKNRDLNVSIGHIKNGNLRIHQYLIKFYISSKLLKIWKLIIGWLGGVSK